MSSRSSGDSRATQRLTKRQTAACLECITILSEACRAFGDEARPRWMRTADGMHIMDDLPFEDLPWEVQQVVDQSDSEIAAILNHYHLNTRQDYQMLTERDLLRIENLLLQIVKPLEKVLPFHR
jgi:hypothetical protein